MDLAKLWGEAATARVVTDRSVSRKPLLDGLLDLAVAPNRGAARLTTAREINGTPDRRDENYDASGDN